MLIKYLTSTTQILPKYFLEYLQETTCLRKQQDKNLQSDVKSVLSYLEKIRSFTNGRLDKTRILGVVAAKEGAEEYLPYTIPRIIKQISEIGMGGDIIIGLNNGFKCDDVIENFSFIPDVNVIHLYTSDKMASTIPANIFANADCEGSPYYLSNLSPQVTQHRIFIIHQKRGLYTSGKIRILGDIYGGLVLQSIACGWNPPEILLTFDAESQFFVNPKKHTVDTESNGLSLLVNDLQKNPDIDILGANNRYVVYSQGMINETKVLLPNFSKDVPLIPWCLNIFHGKYAGYYLKPAGGTIGRTDVIMSLLAAIAKRYPGSRVEDVHLTILAKYAGLRGGIFMDALATNRVPNSTDLTTDIPQKLAWIEQMRRWMAGVRALEINYGKHNIKTILSNSFPWHVLLNPFKFYKGVMEKERLSFHLIYKVSKISLLAFFKFRYLRKLAIESPDILQGTEAKADW